MGPFFHHGLNCGVDKLGGFPLASFVVVGLGCVHVCFCVCFPSGLPLGLIRVLVGCLVRIYLWW